MIDVADDQEQIPRPSYRTQGSRQPGRRSQIRGLIRDPVVVGVREQDQVPGVVAGPTVENIWFVVPTRMPPPYDCMLTGLFSSPAKVVTFNVPT